MGIIHQATSELLTQLCISTDLVNLEIVKTNPDLCWGGCCPVLRVKKIDRNIAVF